MFKILQHVLVLFWKMNKGRIFWHWLEQVLGGIQVVTLALVDAAKIDIWEQIKSSTLNILTPTCLLSLAVLDILIVLFWFLLPSTVLSFFIFVKNISMTTWFDNKDPKVFSKKIFKDLNSAKWPYLLLPAQNLIIFSIKGKKSKETFFGKI